MTPREKLARVIEPDDWRYWDATSAEMKELYVQNNAGLYLDICVSLSSADCLLARWPDIKDIVERE